MKVGNEIYSTRQPEWKIWATCAVEAVLLVGFISVAFVVCVVLALAAHPEGIVV